MIVLSLGVGVQSTTTGLMCAEGEVGPMPDCAIFADTGAEPRHVYEYLDYLEPLLPFPVYRVMKGDGLQESVLKEIAGAGGRFASPPFYTTSEKGGGLLRRQCTREFKIEPITKKIRELLGLSKGQRVPKNTRVIQYIGISTDEAVRMKPNRESFIENRWPLIEKGMSRLDCLQWLRKRGYRKPNKSACTWCPYHDDALWRDMKNNDPESFADAVRMDELIRKGVRGTTQQLFVHRSMKPLSEIDFRNAEDMGQMSMFGDECEGMCGV